ncbi:hypothetical protein LNQ81_03235 [Myroides sp. M-43]|uniref:hypothetical protein n=1 Tax=Myroides oncorhynchi TaxID=2893756 RepID=UPI001E5E297D|nr:hypothetical protein [Myroides oncorhynchi]MCC9041714.1 hypothetical protein [Myroides oncorhynchi]
MEFENKKLAFTVNAQNYIKSISSWGMFLAVLGFIGAAFSIINVFSGFKLSVIYGLFNLIVLAVQVLAAVGLFTFSSKAKNALESRDNGLIDTAFKGMMSYFLYTIISMILSFCMPLVMMTIG